MALNQHLVYVYARERKRLYGNRTLSWAQAVSDVALVFERVQECSQERILLVFRMEIMKLGIVGKKNRKADPGSEAYSTLQLPFQAEEGIL